MSIPRIVIGAASEAGRLESEMLQDLYLGERNTSYINDQIRSGEWRPFIASTHLTGLSRPVRIFLADRKTDPISHDWYGDKDTFCPPIWWDLATGSGSCGLGCRACFLLLSFRGMRDPFQPVIYQNTDYLYAAVRKWLDAPDRMSYHSLGLGIDHFDSLLYEAFIPHARNLAPWFASPRLNPAGSKLVLLTKTANTYYLDDIDPADRANVVVTFSLNPQPIASLWEGKWPDTGESIPPSISARLDAAAHAQEMGFEIRIRLDPILPSDGWQDLYFDFVRQVASYGLYFSSWTLGSYRQKRANLDVWRDRWGLLPVDWDLHRDGLIKAGTHWRLDDSSRQDLYSVVMDAIHGYYPDARIGLCKETHELRQSVGLANFLCNCVL